MYSAVAGRQLRNIYSIGDSSILYQCAKWETISTNKDILYSLAERGFDPDGRYQIVNNVLK